MRGQVREGHVGREEDEPEPEPELQRKFDFEKSYVIVP